MKRSERDKEDIERRLIDFLRCEKPREAFGDGDALGRIATSFDIYFELVGSKEISIREAEDDAKGLGYNTLEEYRCAFEKAVDHYKPIFNGKPVIVKQLNARYTHE
ncbi:MAG: hypothetical protein AABX03_03110 [Nanoarchaeota archaeon]